MATGGFRSSSCVPRVVHGVTCAARLTLALSTRLCFPSSSSVRPHTSPFPCTSLLTCHSFSRPPAVDAACEFSSYYPPPANPLISHLPPPQTSPPNCTLLPSRSRRISNLPARCRWNAKLYARIQDFSVRPSSPLPFSVPVLVLTSASAVGPVRGPGGGVGGGPHRRGLAVPAAAQVPDRHSQVRIVVFAVACLQVGGD